MGFVAPALLAAAAGAGFGHAVLPDHWVPLAVVARARRSPLPKVLRLSLLAGVAHVAFSLLLGAIVIGVGVQFRGIVERRENLIVGGLLIATGVVFAALELVGRGHGHSHDQAGGHSHGGRARGRRVHSHSHGPADRHGHDGHEHEHEHEHEHGHEHEHEQGRGRVGRLLAFVVPFGAAASPDLTILPVFLAAGAVSTTAAVGTLVVFALVTIGTIVVATALGALAGYRLRSARIDRNANLLTAGVLAIIGILVAGNIV
ncbi:hypothetical protein [Nocardia sp. alder85J]|uniref:hypothetical protein n=1 Tax=Nocardia sp. alder85J TaxID=2862949 RepID=UPI001CD2D82C|nr:hypothetical protein [Nocardia sp. alder85J]MCX4098293.1 hypothetical protein [Nocardia sp. alder85J]